MSLHRYRRSFRNNLILRTQVGVDEVAIAEKFKSQQRKCMNPRPI